MSSISEDGRESSSSQPIEMTVVQLLPDFDGSLEDMAFADPVSYTHEELSQLKTEVTLDEAVGDLPTGVFQEPGFASAGFLPPSVLQRIVDSTDDVESLDPDTAKKAFRPCVLGRSSRLVNQSLYTISLAFLSGEE